MVAEPGTASARRRDELTFKGNRQRGRHGWLRLTPAYSVALVEELVAGCGPTDRVLDPFCGSGTTALACAERGVTGHTVDINPFLIWLANAKCAVYREPEVEAAVGVLERALTGPEEGEDGWTPPIRQIEKWWDAPTLCRLAALRSAIEAANVPEAAKNLLRVVFCRGAVALAAVSFGHQSMSFRKTAPGAEETGDEAERFWTAVRAAGEIVLPAARTPVVDGCARACLGDARRLSAALPEGKYTTVITSPPYPNRMSYIRELRPYMYWLGYLESGRQAGELDWEAIGGTWGCATSNLARWQPDPGAALPCEELAVSLAGIERRSPLLAAYVAKYFEDAVRHVRSLREVLTPGARVSYVVGNSKFYDVLLPTERLYAEIFRSEGFEAVDVAAIRKRTSKKELFEYVVTARA